MAGSAGAETKALHVPAAYGQPPDGWTWSRLDNVSEGVFDCPHSTPKLTDAGPFVVRTQDIITGVFRADQAGHVSEETYAERIARVAPSRGDLLYSREGTYFGIAAEVPEKTRVCLGQRMVLIRPDKRRLDFSFLRHWLNSPIMAAHIHGYRDGSVAERLNLPTIRALPILVPPLAEQKAIAAVLGALDDKIELNRRMNATLESMARALFQSWFVDFDPVRAKLDGRQPIGMDQATADLFPDSFQHCECKIIPNGWEMKAIADVTERVTKGDTPTSIAIEAVDPDEPLVPMLRVNAITELGEILHDKLEYIPESIHFGKSRRSILQEHDILYTNAGTIGRVAFVQRDLLPANTNQAIAIVRPDAAKVPPAFLFMLMRQPEFQEALHCDIVQAVQANLALGKISDAKAVLPPSAVLPTLFEPIQGLLNRIWSNQRESRTLATLRDTLLPKLLSGELSVDRAVAEAEAVS